MTLVTPPSGPDFDTTDYEALAYYRREPGYVVHDGVSGPASTAPTLPLWAASTSYKAGQEIWISAGTVAVAQSTHLSGSSYAADKTAGKWVEVAGGGTSGQGLPSTVVTKTANYTAAAGEFVLANAASAGFTVTLPTDPTVGSLITVKKTDGTANVVTVTSASGGTVDGDANATITSPQFGAIFEATSGTTGANAWKVVAPTSSGGSNGIDGKTVRSGTGAPAGGLGVDGDFYIDTAASAIYGPKSAGSWGSATSLVGTAGTNGAMSKIATVTVGVGGAATIDFTSIPGTYSTLLIYATLRGDNASATTICKVQLNGDTAANYDYLRTVSNGGAVSATTGQTGQAFGVAANTMPAGSATAAKAAALQAVLVNYANTTFHKHAQFRSFETATVSAADFSTEVNDMMWRNAAAITRVTLFPTAGNFAQGSVATLFGAG